MAESPNYEIRKAGTREFVVLNGPWTHDVSEIMQSRGLKDLRLSHYTKWRGKSLEFLREVPFLERLDLWAVGIRDLSPLYELQHLTSLSLNGVPGPVDFQRLPRLSELAMAGYRRKLDFSSLPCLRRLDLGNWRPSFYSGVFQDTQLQRLTITGYRGQDLREFCNLAHIEELGLASSSIQSLTGIEVMHRLRYLALTLVNQLHSLDGVQACQFLTNLLIEGAAELRNIDAVSHLRALQEFSLSRCPNLESIRPIAHLPHLRSVCLLQTTYIRDGDLSPLQSLSALQHASFADRPHYNHRSSEFPKAYRVMGMPFASH